MLCCLQCSLLFKQHKCFSLRFYYGERVKNGTISANKTEHNRLDKKKKTIKKQTNEVIKGVQVIGSSSQLYFILWKNKE